MDIAEDVKGRIEQALADTWKKWGGWPAVESGMVNMTSVLADSVMAVYGDAILSERERCAKIAEGYIEFPAAGAGNRTKCTRLRSNKEIASTIRSGAATEMQSYVDEFGSTIIHDGRPLGDEQSAVYSRAECIFHYCPNEVACKADNRCKSPVLNPPIPSKETTE